MIIHLKPVSLYLLALVTSLGCSADQLKLPEPAELIVGNYEAVNPGALLTLKGDSVALSVKRVSADVVTVNMLAYLNNQLTDSLLYEQVTVKLNVAPTTSKEGCVSPFVSLSSTGKIEQLRANCSEKGIITYTYAYIPTGQQAAALINVKFKSL